MERGADVDRVLEMNSPLRTACRRYCERAQSHSDENQKPPIACSSPLPRQGLSAGRPCRATHAIRARGFFDDNPIGTDAGKQLSARIAPRIRSNCDSVAMECLHPNGDRIAPAPLLIPWDSTPASSRRGRSRASAIAWQEWQTGPPQQCSFCLVAIARRVGATARADPKGSEADPKGSEAD